MNPSEDNLEFDADAPRKIKGLPNPWPTVEGQPQVMGFKNVGKFNLTWKGSIVVPPGYGLRCELFELNS